MSDEPEVEVEETQEESPVAKETNPLFNALFDAAEEPEEGPTNEIPVPSSLSEALYEIETEEEEAAEEAEVIKEVEPEVKEIGEPPVASRPKKKTRKIKQVVDPEIPEQIAHAPRVAFSSPEDSEEDNIIKGLIPEEKEYYDLAKFASSNMSEYKNLDKDFLGFFKKSKDYVEKRLKDDPYTDLSDDHEYKDFMEKNRPKFSQIEAKKVERAMITRHAEDAAEARVRPEVERLRKEQEHARKKPAIDQTKAGFRQSFSAILPEDVQEKLRTDGGLEAVQKEDPLGFQVMDQITQNLFTFADAFVDITQGMSAYDETNQTHKELLDWVGKEQELYIQSGQTVQEGKTFMRRERYYATPENQRTQFYTWTDDDLLGLLVHRAKERLDGTLKYQKTMLENSGYIKQGAKPKAVKPNLQAQESAPRFSPTPRSNQPAQEQVKVNTPLSILGM